jgi:hypothetical protein
MIEASKNRRVLVQAVIGIEMRCTSDTFTSQWDRYTRLTVNKRRKFSASFGPDTERYNDGTTYDIEGSVSGTLNRARSKVSGRWRLKITDYNHAGVVTDVCDSGSVRWTAKQ